MPIETTPSESTTQAAARMNQSLAWRDGWRGDPLPESGTDGPYLVEDSSHNRWFVDGELIFRIGGGRGELLTDDVRERIGAWRVVELGRPPEANPPS